MRIEQLAIPAFGPFTDFSISFPARTTDFHLIYGPNEAGKSSLLRAVRDLLYGIHNQTPDSFLHDYKNLRLSGKIVNAAGERLHFQRRKGRGSTLLDASGNSMEEEVLRPWLHAVDRDYFVTMFGLGSEQLRQGAQALLQGQGELGKSLFSASMAGTPVHRILEHLEQQAALLYRGAAQKNVTIRPAAEAYRAAMSRSRESLVRPEQWEAAKKRFEDAEEARRRLQNELRELRLERDWLQRCLDVLPALGQLREQEAELAARPKLPDVPEDLSERFSRFQRLGNEARIELTHVERRIERLQKTIDEAVSADEILQFEQQLETLHAQGEMYREWKNELLRLDSEIAAAEKVIQRGASDLGCQTDSESIELLRVGSEEQLRIQETASELEQLQDAVNQLQLQISQTEMQIADVDHELKQLPDTEVGELRQAVADTETAAEFARNQSAALAAEEAAAALMKSLYLQLRTDIEPQETRHLAVPSAASIRSLEKEQESLLSARENLVTQCRQIEMESRRRSRELKRLIQQHGQLPSVDALREARVRRDQLWVVLRDTSRRMPPADAVVEDATPTEEAFLQAVAEADELADQMYRHATAVVQAEELRLKLAELDEDLKVKQEEVAEADVGLKSWQCRWDAAWNDCRLKPESPAEMLSWRETWVRFGEAFDRWQMLSAENVQRATLIRASEQSFERLFAQPPGTSLSIFREIASQRIRECDEARGTRRALLQRRTTLDITLQQLSAELPGTQSRLDSVAERWNTLRSAASLPDGISVRGCLTLLQQRLQLLNAADQRNTLQQQVELRQRAVREMETQLQQLADACSVPLASSEVLLDTLWNLLVSARRQQDLRKQSESDLKEELRQKNSALETIDAAKEGIVGLAKIAGVQQEDELSDFLTEHAVQQKIRASVTSLRQQMHLSARGDLLDDFIARVEREDADSLQARLNGIDDRVQQFEEQQRHVMNELFEAEQARDLLEQTGDEAAGFRQAAIGYAASLRRDASRFIRLQLAIQLLKEQVEEFRRQNQEPLLARAGELFRRFTHGSFDGLCTSFDTNGQPILTGRRGDQEVELSGMSEGTRDQLFLALRLSAIELHTKRHEPMPVILDDVLITFDDRRTAAILPVLSELSRTTQVMLFTHHQHLAEVAASSLQEDEYQLHRLA